MEFWDICTRVEDLKAAGLMAEKLGWKGLGVVVPVKDFDSLKSKPQPGKTDFSIGLWIEVRNPQDVKKLAQALRKRAELLVVRGGDLEINRAAVATPEVDVLI
jgi:ribonuclease P/MRP protein subunit RPP1